MRPLTRNPEIAKWAADKPCLAALLTELGPYCRLCEIPLTDRASVLNFDRLEGLDPDQRIDDQRTWESSCPICDNCMRAFVSYRDSRVGWPSIPPPPLLAKAVIQLEPNWSPEFPFRYELSTLTKVVEGSGEVIEEGREECVLIFPSDPSSIYAGVVNAFALNTKGINYHTGRRTVSEYSEVTLMDRGVEHRTAAWRRAEEQCSRMRLVAESQGRNVRSLLADQSSIGMRWWARQTRLLAGHTGFWSVWAAVLWKEYQDRDFVTACLWNDEELENGQGRFNLENPFPGTSRPIG